VTTTAPIFIVPDSSREPLRVAAAGTILNVLKEEGDWVQVQFADPQWGPRTGWIASKSIRISRPDLQPMDLSIRNEPDPTRSGGNASTPQTQNDMRTPEQPPRDAMVRVSSGNVALAPSSPKRTWLDVNFGLAMSGADVSLFQYVGILIDKASAYGKPTRGASFDFGAGFMFTPVVGIGASFSGAAHKDIVGLGAGIGTLTLASGATDKLMRTEGAVNLQAMVVPFNSNNFRVRLFGGPSYFRYKADMVYDFDFSRSVVTNYESVNTEGTGWGAHVGGDATYFFSKVVGLGGFARYSRATASILEPMSETQQDIKLGGFQTGGGLRFRF